MLWTSSRQGESPVIRKILKIWEYTKVEGGNSTKIFKMAAPPFILEIDGIFLILNGTQHILFHFGIYIRCWIPSRILFVYNVQFKCNPFLTCLSFYVKNDVCGPYNNYQFFYKETFIVFVWFLVERNQDFISNIGNC